MNKKCYHINMKQIAYLFCIVAVIVFASCKQAAPASLENLPDHKLSEWNKKLTDIIITDVFTPPVCSRIYAYCNVAAYEALVPSNTRYTSFAGKLNGLRPMSDAPEGLDSSYYPISAVVAFTTVAQKLVFNTDAMKELEMEYLEALKDMSLNKGMLETAVAYGRKVGEHVIQWSSTDGYLQRNAHPGYVVVTDPASWQPTPPKYMDPVEPNWGTLRPFAIDSSSLFRPFMTLKFDTMSKSDYHHEAMMVYDAVNKLTSHDTMIARYWDCNPNVSVTSGHVTYFQQQISPGGHWMFIAASVADRENMSMIATAAVLSKVAVAIADAFISCWEAKYAYKTVRPETYINRHIDKTWKPFIQTPPFPEYPSGHSTISASAATMLTRLFGDNYVFIDSAEVPFGRPARKFTSFREAAAEASISRMYGGIHYLKSLNESAKAGAQLGDYVIRRFEGVADSLAMKN